MKTVQNLRVLNIPQPNWQALLVFLLASALLLAVPVVLAEEEQEEPETEESVPSVYFNVDPPFVTNYGGTDRLRYVKVEVTLKVAGNPGVTQVTHHMPMIRDKFLSLFAKQTSSNINTVEGKEAMRAEALENIGAFLADEDDESFLQEVLFTSFVAHSL